MILAIDIGGTKTALALFDGKALIEKKVFPTQCSSWVEYSALLHSAVRDWQFDCASIATTGRLVQGVLKPLNRNMIGFWADLPIERLMTELLRCPVTVVNDAAAAAWAEFVSIEDPRISNLLYITVSTGVGTGLVLNKALSVSENGMASHGGHIRHRIAGAPQLPCSCGRIGCIETIASGTSISSLASEALGRSLSTVDVFEGYEKEERCACVIEQSAQSIAELIIDCNALVGLDSVVLGGGVGLNPLYSNRVQAYLYHSPDVYQMRLKQAVLSVDSGLLGAALLVK